MREEAVPCQQIHTPLPGTASATRSWRYGYRPKIGKLLTYATPAIESVMTDYCARISLPLSIPSSRYHQLSRVGHVCAEARDDSEPALIDAVCKELEVLPRAAAELLKDYRTLFHVQPLGEDVFSISGGEDPAKMWVIDSRHQGSPCDTQRIAHLMDDVLTGKQFKNHGELE